MQQIITFYYLASAVREERKGESCLPGELSRFLRSIGADGDCTNSCVFQFP
jgi:hypothetical protein